MHPAISIPFVFYFTKTESYYKILIFQCIFSLIKRFTVLLSSQKSAAIDIISFYRQLSSEVVCPKS